MKEGVLNSGRMIPKIEERMAEQARISNSL